MYSEVLFHMPLSSTITYAFSRPHWVRLICGQQSAHYHLDKEDNQNRQIADYLLKTSFRKKNKQTNTRKKSMDFFFFCNKNIVHAIILDVIQTPNEKWKMIEAEKLNNGINSLFCHWKLRFKFYSSIGREKESPVI